MNICCLYIQVVLTVRSSLCINKNLIQKQVNWLSLQKNIMIQLSNLSFKICCATMIILSLYRLCTYLFAVFKQTIAKSVNSSGTGGGKENLHS